jgi:hypothetical protein
MKNEKALSLQNITILFDTAWDTYKKYFHTLIKVNLVPAIVGILALSAFSLAGDFEEIAGYVTKADLVSVAGLIFGASIITIFVSSLNYIAQVVILEEGPSVSIYKSYNKASQILFPYFWIMILVGLIILFGMVLLIVLRFVVATLLAFLLSIALGILKGFAADISPNNQDVTNILLDFLYTLIVTPYFVVYGYELYKDIVKANEETESVESANSVDNTGEGDAWKTSVSADEVKDEVRE